MLIVKNLLLLINNSESLNEEIFIYKFCCVNFHISNNIKIHINKLFLHESVYKVLLNHTFYTQILTTKQYSALMTPIT